MTKMTTFFKKVLDIGLNVCYNEYEVALLEYYGDGEWDFDTEETTTIMKDSVSGFYDTTDLENTGLYEKLKNGMYAEVDESDFEMSSRVFGDKEKKATSAPESNADIKSKTKIPIVPKSKLESMF